MTEVPGLAFWNRVADRYAARPVRDAAAYEATLADVAARLSPTDRVLEIGCGTGSTALRLGGEVAEWHATDASHEMIRIAHARPAPPGVSFVVADADQADGTALYDAVCAFHILHLVPDIDATLAHLRTRLKPGGLFISKTWCFGDVGWRLRLLIPVLRRFGLFPPARALSEGELRRAILAAGFELEAERTFGPHPHAPFIVARRSR
ncbi:Ubiquinone/menaquinone biosynthesis C-methylase UbiE [[Luteovulum] sphaeroides subsp. megalophilum]|uniref:class I SAM-dependent methyltransferase n=1 Tax=Cereibacter sphaeroides TaxID=1063 RepID=UPI000B72ECD3|nr:class I SAM-dependent methyltransferase [Cereibacter sphaeroides]SNT42980.1 Ubiquinone/menaquinone biosynthesis C-methylase UbiE [[Luteovulum] sphaeroides subsp. megalophilum]